MVKKYKKFLIDPVGWMTALQSRKMLGTFEKHLTSSENSNFMNIIIIISIARRKAWWDKGGFE